QRCALRHAYSVGSEASFSPRRVQGSHVTHYTLHPTLLPPSAAATIARPCHAAAALHAIAQRRNRSPPYFREHLSPRRRQDHADGKAAAVRRGHSACRGGEGA